MAYIRSKMINGCGPYYYRVKSVRQGKRVRQVFVAYIGKSPPQESAPGRSESVVPKPEASKPFLEIEGAGERKELKTWDRVRYARARSIAKATGSSFFQADALAKTAWRMGLDPEKVDWDQLQGKDLSYDEKVEKLSDMSGQSSKTEKDYDLEHELYLEAQADREKYRQEA
jgi:hypothetical protein